MSMTWTTAGSASFRLALSAPAAEAESYCLVTVRSGKSGRWTDGPNHYAPRFQPLA